MFIARQPIFDKNLSVFGYELLFRSRKDSQGFDGSNSQSATASVISGLYEIGLDNIVEDKMVFINFDDVFIHSDAFLLIKPNRMVVEMLEKIKVDSRLLERLAKVKKEGYQIALDDFNEDFENYPLIPYADIIKYDLFLTPLETIARQIPKVIREGKIPLAEKVETYEIYLQARAMGFELFQGYFFSKPCIAGRSCNKAPTKLHYFQMLSELRKKDPSFLKLAQMIELDVVLTYRILRLVSARSQGSRVESIQSALAYMGLNQIERWLSTLMLQDLIADKPFELMKISLIRSHFAQLIAKELKMSQQDQQSASLMGLFSTLDGILDQTMEEALEDIGIPEEIEDALVGQRGPLYPIYNLVLAYEMGNWQLADQEISEMAINHQIINQNYRDSIKRMQEIVKLIG